MDVKQGRVRFLVFMMGIVGKRMCSAPNFLLL